MRQRFVTGQGGTLVFVPPEAALFGAPDAATVSIRSSRGLALPTPVDAVAAVVDPLATTVAEDAEEGDDSIVVATTTGMKPATHYLVTCADGARMLVECAGFSAESMAVLLAAPLARAVSAQDVFTGVELSYVLTGAQCPDPSTWGFPVGYERQTALSSPRVSPTPLYRAAWRYRIAGAWYDADQTYEVNLRVLKPVADPDDVQGRLPANWSELLRGGPIAIRRQLAQAWDDLLDDLAREGFLPDRIIDADRLRRPHASKVLANLGTLFSAGNTTWKPWADDRAAEYRSDLQAALTSDDWYDAHQDLVEQPNERKIPSVKLSR